jgi:hypothetical protein
MRFPFVIGKNLEGKRYQLPMDFEGEKNLVFLAFHQFQQSHVNSWLPFARTTIAENPTYRFYELPTMNNMG